MKEINKIMIEQGIFLVAVLIVIICINKGSFAF